MGGKAFAHHNPPLATPRLASALYNKLRDEYINLLSKCFEYVASPMPAPGKSSHGDIDILVASPHKEYTVNRVGISPQKLYDPTKQAIVELLHPAGIIHESETMNLAMPHPELPNSYVQLDVHIVTSIRHWRWLLFTHSYGDAFNLIGTSLHKVGMVGTDKGLFVRDAEMEAHDGKKSRIFLTDDPYSVLTFLRLDPTNWLPASNSKSHTPAHPFATSTDLFHAICSMRYFSAGCFSTSTLRASDRQRLRKREQYTTFVDEFLPAMLAETTVLPSKPISTSASMSESGLDSVTVSESSNAVPSRKEVFHEALAYWNKEQDWRRIKMAWEYERINLLTRRIAREEKKFALTEEERYFAAWIAWSKVDIGEH